MAVYRYQEKWRADVFLKGKRIATKSGFRTKGEAVDWLEKTRQHYRLSPLEKRQAYTFENLVTEFSTKHLTTVRESTRDRYRNDIDLRIVPFFQFFKLEDITPNAVEEFKSSLMGTMEPKSVNNCLMTLHLMFKKAEKWKMVTESPYEVDLLPVPKSTRYVWWDKQDYIVRFLTEAKRRSRYYPAYALALETGMRLGEITGLSKQDIDFELGRIHVWRQWSESYQGYGPCKHDLERWIDFDPKSNLAAVLSEAVKKSRCNEMIFVTSTGKRVRNRKLAQAHFHHIIKQAKVPRITFHGLRHTFASWYMREIDNVWALKDILGHVDIKTTMRYAHHSARHKKQPLGISNFLANISPITAGVVEGKLLNQGRKVRLEAPGIEYKPRAI